MLYVIIGKDAPGSLARSVERFAAEHLDTHPRTLSDAGRVAIAGPCPAVDSPDPGEAGFTGSVIIAEFPSLESTPGNGWSAIPYVTEGVFESFEVRPFVKVLP